MLLTINWKKKTIETLVMIKYYTVKRKKAKNMSQVSSKLSKVAQSIKYFDSFGNCCEECDGHWTYSYRFRVIIDIHRLCHRYHHNYDYHHHYYFMRLTSYSPLFCRVIVSWVSPTHLNPPSLCARRLSRSIKIFVCFFITLATLANFVCNRKFTTNNNTKLFRIDL